MQHSLYFAGTVIMSLSDISQQLVVFHTSKQLIYGDNSFLIRQVELKYQIKEVIFQLFLAFFY